MTSTSISAENLKAFGRCIATSVFVVTTVDASGKPHAATICTSTSLSLAPPMILICLAHSSNTLMALRESARFRLHVLSAGQDDLSQTFAGKGPAKGEVLAALRERNGLPMLEGAVAAAECNVVDEFSVGDHSIVVGALDDISIEGGEPLIYHRAGYTALARAPMMAAL